MTYAKVYIIKFGLCQRRVSIYMELSRLKQYYILYIIFKFKNINWIIYMGIPVKVINIIKLKIDFIIS